MAAPVLTDKELAESFFKFYERRLQLQSDNRIENLEQCYFTPDVIELAADQKVYAFGDVHGDFEALWYNLLGAGLIDEGGSWTGGNGVVIQLGDMFDGRRPMRPPHLAMQPTRMVKNSQEMKIINFLKNLHLEAIANGGMVITMFGNHDFYRLLTWYDVDGNPVLPSGANFFMRYPGNALPGLNGNLPYAQRMREFMTDNNRRDFDRNRSLYNIGNNHNAYRGENEGFHRQLLASCASKLFLKLKWQGSDVGILASHGEKAYRFFLKMKTFLVDGLDKINSKYNLSFDVAALRANNDNLIVFLNSLFSFFLRRCFRRNIDVRQDIFALSIYYFLFSLSNEKEFGFLWTYMTDGSPSSVCLNAAASMRFFGLNPKRSICVSGHSGHHSQGRLRINGTALCSAFSGDPNISDNTIIMTDVTSSRAFGNESADYVLPDGTNYRNPQMVEIRFNPATGELEAKVHESIEFDVFSNRQIPLPERAEQHHRPVLRRKVDNPQNLRLIDLE